MVKTMTPTANFMSPVLTIFGVTAVAVSQDSLHNLVARLDKSQTDDIDRTNPASHANYRYLSCSEKDRRLKRFHQLHRADKQKIARLQSALDAAIQQRGVSNIDEELHQLSEANNG